MILILVNTLDFNKKVKEENKILLKDLTSIDDINTCEYIRCEQERIVQKIIKTTKTIFGYTKFVWAIFWRFWRFQINFS